jgi:hypothetical protein
MTGRADPLLLLIDMGVASFVMPAIIGGPAPRIRRVQTQRCNSGENVDWLRRCGFSRTSRCTPLNPQRLTRGLPAWLA